MKTLSKLKENVKQPKVQLALSLAVATLGVMLPDHSESADYCILGTLGDCELTTSGTSACTVGWIFNDCK